MDNFGEILIKWYQDNKRDLPWRRTKNPYLIWISEIILQQTRVAQGYDYYQRFVKRFPDVFSLAAADEDEVMKYWQAIILVPVIYMLLRVAWPVPEVFLKHIKRCWL